MTSSMKVPLRITVMTYTCRKNIAAESLTPMTEMIEFDMSYTKVRTLEERRAYSKEYSERNKERVKEWQRESAARKKAATAARRAQRQKLIKTKRDILKYLKSDMCCTDCGKEFPPECLDFDHVPERGPKSFILSQIPTGTSLNEIIQEALKCDIVCANCHAVRTTTRRGPRKAKAAPVVEKRIQLIYDLKKNPCIDCGESFHPHSMQFDHVPGRGDKSFILAEGHHKSIEAIMEEVKKCDLLCANCHRKRTKSRGRTKLS